MRLRGPFLISSPMGSHATIPETSFSAPDFGRIVIIACMRAARGPGCILLPQQTPDGPQMRIVRALFGLSRPCVAAQRPYTETTPIVSVGAMDNVPRVRENSF